MTRARRASGRTCWSVRTRSESRLGGAAVLSTACSDAWNMDCYALFALGSALGTKVVAAVQRVATLTAKSGRLFGLSAAWFTWTCKGKNRLTARIPHPQGEQTQSKDDARGGEKVNLLWVGD